MHCGEFNNVNSFVFYSRNSYWNYKFGFSRLESCYDLAANLLGQNSLISLFGFHSD